MYDTSIDPNRNQMKAAVEPRNHR